MKIKHLAAVSLILAVMVAVSGCTKTEPSLYSLVADDALMVANANLTTLIDNSGCKLTDDGIVLSDNVKKLFSEDPDNVFFEKLLKVKGVDLSQIVIVTTQDEITVVTSEIIDQARFDEWAATLSDEEAVMNDGYKVYYSDSESVVVAKDGYLNIFIGEEITLNVVNDVAKAAAKNPIAGWKIDRLASGNLINYVMSMEANTSFFGLDMNDYLKTLAIARKYDAEAIKTATNVLNVSLEGLSLDVKGYTCDAKGDVFKSDSPLCDTSMLKYASASDVAVAMFAIPQGVDWKPLLMSFPELGLDEMAGLVSEVLSAIEGTVMVAVNPGDDPVDLSKWSIVAGAQMAEGKAAQYASLLKMLVRNEDLKVAGTETDFNIDLEGMIVYIRVEGDAFIASTNPITGEGGCKLDVNVLKEKTGGLVVELEKGSPICRWFYLTDCGAKLSITSDNESTCGKLTLTDTDGTLVENLVGSLLNGDM